MTKDPFMPSPGLPVVLIGCCLLLALSQGAQADINVTISGVVQAPPPCEINRGTTLTVPFGDALLTTRIDGINYQRGVPYEVSCNNPSSNAMTLELKGTGAAFDAKSLATSKADLGVKLFVDGADWPINTAVKFTYPTLPDVQAVPVKRLGSTLTGGAFTAVATLVVVLQ